MKRNITLGDTLDPINAVLYDDNGNPIDLSSPTIKFAIEDDSGTEVLAETETGITKQPTQTFTLDSTNNWIACNSHGYKVGDIWVPATSGSLSGTGLTAAVRYKVVETDVDWFRVSLRNGGAPVTIAGAGTPTHSGYIVGSVQMDLASTEVDTAGNYRGWFVRISGSEKRHHPDAPGFIRLEIGARGN
jgi:hypothetical protein